MKNRIISFILSFIVLFTFTGCSKTKVTYKEENDQLGISQENYCEEIIKIADDLSVINNISKVDDGSIIAVGLDKDSSELIYISHDNGKSWKRKEIQHLTFGDNNVIIGAINILNNGNLLVSYFVIDSVNKETVKYGLIDNQGEIREINISFELESTSSNNIDNSPTMFTSLNNGDIIFISEYNEIIQLDTNTFKEKYTYKSDSFIIGFSIVDDYLIINSDDGICKYDTRTGKLSGNLDSLIEDLDEKSSDSDIMAINSKVKNYYYYYNNLGLFGYDLNTEKSKLIIEDSKYLNGSDTNILGLIELENDEFLILMYDSLNDAYNLISYKKGVDNSQISETEIKIYSLFENKELKKLVSKFNLENPEIFINYEIGLTENDGVMISDAIKTLNTEIIAGNGPDLILLDNLPIDSYIEKGLLADISDVVSEYNGELFNGIIDSYVVNNKIYQLPLSFSIPVMIGSKEVINKVNDLESLLDAVKEYDSKSENRIFENLGTPEEFIYSLYSVYENDWLNNNKINKDNLIDFMEKAKEIYNISKVKEDKYLEQEVAAMLESGWSEEDLDSMEILKEGYKTSFAPSIDIVDFGYPKNETFLAYGGIDSFRQINELVNLLLYHPTLEYKVLTNSNDNIFIPINKIGINNDSKNKDIAKEVLKCFISENKNSQNITLNKKSFIDNLQMKNTINTESEFNESNNHYLRKVLIDFDENGKKLEFPQYWPNDDDITRLINEVENLNVEPEVNSILLTEVANQFKEVIENDFPIKKAVSNIINNVELYLSE